MQPNENVNVPAFLNKLWNMVNDPWTDQLICWSPGGKSFVIQNQAQFWYELLPQYYKHNNMSSFVRQLNMYGFHKKSCVENGTMDSDKDEIQFYHPYFQKDQPELLKNIKRKVTGSTRISHAVDTVPQANVKQEDLTKVLTEVKSLKGKQATVDSQLSAMKQENAVLWRELAVLRQKHMTQQKIVNKLIQFLVTIVQPSRMGGLGVKRHYQLMLNESPQVKIKKAKKTPVNTDGPTIHELDSTTSLQDDLLTDNIEAAGEYMAKSPSVTQFPLVSSPPEQLLEDHVDPIPPEVLLETQVEASPSTTESANTLDDLNTNEIVVGKGEQPLDQFLECDNYNDLETLPIVDDIDGSNPDTLEDEKVFLNPSTQDTLLSNFVPGDYKMTVANGGYSNKTAVTPKDENKKNDTKKIAKTKDLAVATRDPNFGYSKVTTAEDLDLHVESTQSELEQLKDILNGCNTFDANALLGFVQLFSDESLPYELSLPQETEEPRNDGMTSGSELATFRNNDPDYIDFTQLFDYSTELPSPNSNVEPLFITNADIEAALSTPQVSSNGEPIFSNNATGKQKKQK